MAPALASYLSLFLALFPIVCGFDYKDFRKNWECEEEGMGLGNFPNDVDFKKPRKTYKLNVDADSWTTFPVEKSRMSLDNRRQLLVRPWRVPNHPIGFYVRPKGYGRLNRIIFQMALSDTSPTVPPYLNVTSIKAFHPKEDTVLRRLSIQDSSYEPFWDLMQKGLFNCHINRATPIRYEVYPNMNLSLDQIIKRKYEILEELDAIAVKCVKECTPGQESKAKRLKDEVMDEIPPMHHRTSCLVGSQSPLCCYQGFPKYHKDKIKKELGPAYSLSRQSKCQSRAVTHGKTFTFFDELCGTPPKVSTSEWTPKLGRKLLEGHLKREVFFATQMKHPICNKNLYRSRDSCLENFDTGIRIIDEPIYKPNHFPCLASCYKSMIVQVEITPNRNNPASVQVTVVASRYHRISQPSFGRKVIYKGKISPFFGYSPLPSTVTKNRIDYLGFDLRKGIEMNTEEYTGIWFRWVKQSHNANKKAKPEDAFAGPMLQIGIEGSELPVINFDFGHAEMMIGDKKDPFGFRFGWRGVEMRRPKISSVFQPQFVTINTPQSSQGFDRRSEGLYCPQRVPRTPDPKAFSNTTIIAISTSFLFCILIATLLGLFYGKYKRRKKEKLLEEQNNVTDSEVENGLAKRLDGGQNKGDLSKRPNVKGLKRKSRRRKRRRRRKKPDREKNSKERSQEQKQAKDVKKNPPQNDDGDEGQETEIAFPGVVPIPLNVDDPEEKSNSGLDTQNYDLNSQSAATPEGTPKDVDDHDFSTTEAEVHRTEEDDKSSPEIENSDGHSQESETSEDEKTGTNHSTTDSTSSDNTSD